MGADDKSCRLEFGLHAFLFTAGVPGFMVYLPTCEGGSKHRDLIERNVDAGWIASVTTLGITFLIVVATFALVKKKQA